MTISTPDYCRFCSTTWAAPTTPSGDPYNSPDTVREMNILHAILGLAGEDLEVQEVAPTYSDAVAGNVANPEEIYKELGDLLYYTVMLFHVQGLSLPVPTSPGHTPTEALEALLNQTKRMIFYRLPVNIKGESVEWWNVFYHVIEPKFEYIKELNYTKLSTRYPDGSFTPQHANEKLDS